MKSALKISVIIPTLNRPDDLSLAVSSILEQSILPAELIIVDQSIDSDSYKKVNEIFIK